MKDSDEIIDRVFAGLRDVEADEGMERRIMAAVHQRAAPPRALPIRWLAIGGFALAAAAVFVLLVSPRHVAEPAPVQVVVQTQPQLQSMPRESAIPALPRRHTTAIRANAEVPALPASFPAPPMPLTEQEQLLIRVARRGEPQAVPVLDPDALAQQETRSELTFEAVLASAPRPSILNPKEDIR